MYRTTSGRDWKAYTSSTSDSRNRRRINRSVTNGASKIHMASLSSESVGLQQAEPDLADRGECRHRVPEPLQGPLTDDRDGGGVDEFADTRADQRRAEQHPAVLVDHEL